MAQTQRKASPETGATPTQTKIPDPKPRRLPSSRRPSDEVRQRLLARKQQDEVDEEGKEYVNPPPPRPERTPPVLTPRQQAARPARAAVTPVPQKRKAPTRPVREVELDADYEDQVDDDEEVDEDGNPVFNPERQHNEIYGETGLAGYIQDGNKFDAGGRFVSVYDPGPNGRGGRTRMPIRKGYKRSELDPLSWREIRMLVIRHNGDPKSGPKAKADNIAWLLKNV